MKYFFYFVIFSIIILGVSFINLPKFWNIDQRVLFDRNFIPRHYLIILEWFIPFALGYEMYRTNFIFKIKKKWLFLIPIILFPLRFVYQEAAILPFTSLMIGCIILLSYKLRKGWLIIFVLFVNDFQAAYILGTFTVILFYFIWKDFVQVFKRNSNFKALILFVLVFVLLFYFSSLIMSKVSEDPNSLWRLKVWENEINTLSQTHFTGIGFGSSYVTWDFYKYVDNANMYMDDDGMTMYSQLFKVANHNSFLDMFYRMGLIGGVLFILINIQLIKIISNLYLKSDSNIRMYLKAISLVFIYQTIVISLNPGLEMIQFSISYLLSVAVLLSVIFKAIEIQIKKKPYNR
jgi:hypothetical protein